MVIDCDYYKLQLLFKIVTMLSMVNTARYNNCRFTVSQTYYT